MAKLKLLTKKKTPKETRNTTFSDYRADFDSLTPVKLKRLGVVAPKAFRPNFSRRAKELGVQYASLSVSAEDAVYFLVE